MNNFLKRTWAQINLDCINHNYNIIRDCVDSKSKIMCVVKADAYGHGAVKLAQEFQDLGADWLAVSNLDEALQIRKSGIDMPILILGYTPVNMSKTLADYNISQAVVSEDYAIKLSKNAVSLGICLNVHIKLDTGMSRIGILAQNDEQVLSAANAVERINKLDGIHIEGLFTHFAVSDEAKIGRDFTKRQYEYFKRAIDIIKDKKGINIPFCHCCNSGAIINYPDMCLDMVRPGIILYGLLPSLDLNNYLDLKPAMQLKSTVSLVKEIDKDVTVSYGRTFSTKRITKIATVPIGYADGYPRNLSGRSYMLVNSKKANVIGRICMDQLMLDVTEIENIKEGDIVTVFGEDGENKISVDDISKLNNTINYEMVCLVGKRVPRVYIKNGKVVGELNYISK